MQSRLTNDDFPVCSGLFAAMKAGDYEISIHRDYIFAVTYLPSGMEDSYELRTALDLRSWLIEKGYMDVST